MTAATAALGGRRTTPPRIAALGLLLSVPLGCGLALVLQRFPPPLAFALGAGGGLLLVVALALARYDAAVALGFVVLGIATVEPAPSDAVFAVVIAVALATGRFRHRAVPSAVVAMLALFGALNVMSAVEVADPELAALYFGIGLYLAALAVWLCGYVSSARRARLVVRAYLAAAVSSAAVGILAAIGWLPGAELLLQGGRARALFQDPNVFGPFLVPAALILLEEIVRPRLLEGRRIAKLALLALLLLGILFSYSRGAWLNLTVGIVILGAVLALRGAARQALALVVVGVVAATVVTGTVLATGSADFLAERARPQSYDSERFGGQRAGLRAAAEHPLGLGPGQFEAVADISAHSTYARALGEQGFPGLLLLLTLLGFTLAAGVRNAARGRGTHGLGSAALLGAWCGLLANSAFVDTLHWRHLWVVAALIWAAPVRGTAP